MIRKWTTILLALILAVMLPLCAVAEILQHTLTIEPGDLIASEPAIADLLDVLAITVAPGEKGGALTLTLGDTDIATIAVGADADALYVYSGEILGEEVLCANWNDLFEFIKGMIQTELIDEDGYVPGMEAVMEQVDLYKAQLIYMLENGVEMNTGVMPKEEAMEQVSVVLGDYPEMMAWLEGIYEELTPENGEFTDADRDTADQKYSMILDNEDFIALLDTDYIYNVFQQQILQSDPDIDGDSLVQMTEQNIAEGVEVFKTAKFDLTTDVYTLDEGQTTVGLDMIMVVEPQEDPSEALKMTMNYDRHTTEAGVSHTGDMQMAAEGEDVIAMKLEWLTDTADKTSGIAGLLADGEEIVVQFGAENAGEAVRERFASLYLRSDATAILAPSASDRPIITFKVASQPSDIAAIGMIDKAELSTSKDIMKMYGEEMEALATDVSARFMQVVFNAMSKLPTSTLSLFMGEM